MKTGRRIVFGLSALALVAALALALAACGSNSAGAAGASSAPAADTMVGAGSTFAAPLYSAWAQTYQGVNGVKLNYQAIGSGGGISQIEAKTVDFGATDAPLTPSDLQSNGLVQFPTMVGGVVPIINVSGIAQGQLKLDGPTLADIFLGKVTTWNDAAIAKAQSRHEPAVDQDRRRPPLRQLGHVVDLHELPLGGVVRAGRARSAPTRRPPGRWAPAAPRAPAWPRSVAPGRRVDRLRRVRVRQAEQPELRAAPERRRQVRQPDAGRVRGGRQERDVEPVRRLRHGDRQRAGRDLVADHRRLVHPDAEGSRRTPRGPRCRSSSSTGRTGTAPRRPRASTTCRSPPRSTTWSRSSGRARSA